MKASYPQQLAMLFTQQNSYHNSLPIKSEKVLAVKERKAQGLDAVVFQVLKENPYASFTPPAMHLLVGQQWPLSSVRRALTNLTKRGKAYITGELRPGLYGEDHLNNSWRYKQPKSNKQKSI